MRLRIVGDMRGRANAMAGGEPPSPTFRVRPIALAVALALAEQAALGAPPLPAGTLPVPAVNWIASGAATRSLDARTLTINQSTPAAILNWNSFNIAADSAVVFRQAFGAGSTVLNRIADPSLQPSIIQGRLSANGQVYLINRNGIVFDQGAQINVQGLVASSLEINDQLFLSGILSNVKPGEVPAFSASAGAAPPGTIVIEAGAEIRTPSGGRVMLFAPQAVVNNGLISTPEGQTILAAGGKVYLASSTDNALRGLLVEVDNGGTATNANLGQIIAAQGNATIVGLAVNQAGRISATTSVRENGSIRLVARDTVTGVATSAGVQVPKATNYGNVAIGAGSITEVRPEYSDPTTTQDSQSFTRSSIEVAGKTIQVGAAARMTAAGGNIALTAQQGADFLAQGQPPNAGVRIYVDSGAVLDVSGSQAVDVPLDRNLLRVELRGDELKDAPLLRDGPLRGATVYVDARRGTPLADISGYAAQIARGVGERTAAGGNIVLKSEDELIVRQGARFDVSGGSLDYAGGAMATSRLVGADGRIYDISTASPDRIYVGLADTFTVAHNKWGQTQTFTTLQRGQYVPGYVQGESAGSITIQAAHVALDGGMSGNATAGPNQRDPGSAPLGGQLVLDLSLTGLATGASVYPGVTLQMTHPLLPADFLADSALPAYYNDNVRVDTALFAGGGFNRFALKANGAFTLASDVHLSLAPAGASFSVAAQKVDVYGTIDAPGATVSLQSRWPGDILLAQSEYGVTLHSGAAIRVGGRWVNDLLDGAAGALAPQVAINGGNVVLSAFGDVTVANGASIDVSAGGWLSTSGTVQPGASGSITLAAGRYGTAGVSDAQRTAVTLDGTLTGYDFGAGGSLTISTSKVLLGASTASSATFARTPAFFGVGGFATFALNGEDGLEVLAGTQLSPAVETLMLDPSYRAARSGSALDVFAVKVVLPEGMRPPGSITLSADSKVFGNLVVDPRATIHVGPQGDIALQAGKQLTVYGTVEARGGNIALSTLEATDVDGYVAGASVWLAAGSLVSARGDVVLIPNATGLRQGSVLDGGSVTLTAGRGYVVTEAGSVIDVSGTAAALDIPSPIDVRGSSAVQRESVASAAGNIAVVAQEGALLNGTFFAQSGGGPAQSGGALTVTLQPAVRNNPAFPSGERGIVVSEAGVAPPAGLGPGETIDAHAFDPARSMFSRRVYLSAGAIEAAGFDEVALTAPDFVRFSGPVELAARRGVAIDAPAIRAEPGAQAAITAAYVSLANTSGLNPPDALGGTGTLAVAAALIDFEGPTVLQGIGSATFSSAGDIRFKGFHFVDGPATLTGSLTAGGDLTFIAQQLYPTSASAFTIATDTSHGAISIAAAAGSASPVYSAAGRLALNAGSVFVDGVVKAPLGEIDITAAKELHVKAHGVLSVAADVPLMLFGHTELDGRDYAYALDASTNLLYKSLPEKTIRLDGPQVTLDKGSKINVSGGGDLLAYEFVKGPGGSTDVLDAAVSPSSFAVLPGFTPSFAPYDQQEYRAGNAPSLAAGDRVYLSGGLGLPAGYYTLLPARYALLPGAYLVTAASGRRDFSTGRVDSRLDGTVVVSGYRAWNTLDGSVVSNARTQGFVIASQDWATQHSEYKLTYADGSARRPGFFAQAATGPQVADAGRLTIHATDAMTLQGQLTATTSAGGRGAEVDLDAPNIAVVGTGAQASDGFVAMNVADLNALGASSLLLGGQRSAGPTGAIQLSVGAAKVEIDTGKQSTLAGPDIIIAAGDEIVIAADARIASSDAVATRAKPVNVAGDGVVVRVSSAPTGVARQTSGASQSGAVSIGAGSKLAASGSLVIDAGLDATVGDNVQFVAPLLALAADRVALGDVPHGTGGLALNAGLLSSMSGVSTLQLRGYSSIDLFGAVSLGGGGASSALTALLLDTPALRGYGTEAKVIASRQITVQNSSSATSGASAGDGTGALALEAVGTSQAVAGPIRLGNGQVAMSGFGPTTFKTDGDFVLGGQGGLSSNSTITIDARRVTADTQATYHVSAAGALQLTQTGTRLAPQPSSASGASVTFEGKSVDIDAAVVLPSGVLNVKATGSEASDSVVVTSAARIDVAGSDRVFDGQTVSAPAGSVGLSSASGDVVIGAMLDPTVALAVASAPLIDLRGGSASDSGTLTLSASNGRVGIDADLTHKPLAVAAGAAGQRGGSINVDASRLDNFDAIVALIADGGFSNLVSLRARHGAVVVGATDTIRASQITISADAAGIEVNGTLAGKNGGRGGEIALWAHDDVKLKDGSVLNAAAASSTSAGGTVTLGATAGYVDIGSGSTIDVSGGASGAGGSLLLRALRTASDVQIRPVGGQVRGAQAVIVEAVRQYANASTLNAQFLSSTITGASSDTAKYMASAASTIRNRLPIVTAVRPGVEIDGVDITLASDWSLYSTSRPGGQPGALTIRASGDLTLNGSLSDGFTSAQPAAAVGDGTSWSYRLVAGADSSAADPVAVIPSPGGVDATQGTLTLAAGKLVRTGTGFISIAAGRDVVLSDDRSVIYTGGMKSPTVPGFPNRSYTETENGVTLTSIAPAYTMGGGDITVHAAGDIIGAPSSELISDWLYRRNAGARGSGDVFTNPQTTWWVRFPMFRQGIGVLGGGELRIDADGDISNLGAVSATNGRLGGAAGSSPDTANLRVDGGGDVSIRARGDIQAGVFYVARGNGELWSGGSITSAQPASAESRPVYAYLALGDGSWRVTARGDANIETVINPTLIPQATPSDVVRASLQSSGFSTYAAGSSVTVQSISGNVAFWNNAGNVASITLPQLFGDQGVNNLDAFTLVPGSLTASALQGSISIASGMTLAPSPTGNLQLYALRGVTIDGPVRLPDVDPARLAGVLNPATAFSVASIQGEGEFNAGVPGHSTPALHTADASVVHIAALTGDLTFGASGALELPKAARLYAGQDILDPSVSGQNLRATDATELVAGRDIVFATPRSDNGTQLSNAKVVQLAGPGSLDVTAGRNIDLGTSVGIVTRGNIDNPFLPEGGASILVQAGVDAPTYDRLRDLVLTPGAADYAVYAPPLLDYVRAMTSDPSITPEQALVRFEALAPELQANFLRGVMFQEVRQAGRDANRVGPSAYDHGYDAIAALYSDASVSAYRRGDIALFFSQIKTEQGGGIDLVAPYGSVNAGLANSGKLSKTAADLGVVTLSGGSIRALVDGDFLVNQSRVFTIGGGDILIWSSNGNIDAGKGAKTATATPPPVLRVTPDGTFFLDTTESIQGSGIGVLLGRAGIVPGDVDLVAPKGEVNAGDAGIRVAGNLNIAAVRVIGAENIQVGGASAGVPVVNTGALGAIAASVGNVGAQASQAAERQLRASAANSLPQNGAAVPSFITVEVLGIGEDK